MTSFPNGGRLTVSSFPRPVPEASISLWDGRRDPRMKQPRQLEGLGEPQCTPHSRVQCTPDNEDPMANEMYVQSDTELRQRWATVNQHWRRVVVDDSNLELQDGSYRQMKMSPFLYSA